MLRGYSKFLDVLEKVEKAILAVTVGIMVIIIAYQVIMRYIFAHANSWSCLLYTSPSPRDTR